MTIVLGSSYVILWGLVLLQSLLIVLLLKQLTELRRRAAGDQLHSGSRLPVGSAVPEIAILDPLTGGRMQQPLFGRADGAVLFLSADCVTCADLAAEARTAPDAMLRRLVVVCKGTEAACRHLAALAGPTLRLVVNADAALSRDYGVTAYPTVVIVDQEWRVVEYRMPRTLADVIRLAEPADVASSGWAREKAYEVSTR